MARRLPRLGLLALVALALAGAADEARANGCVLRTTQGTEGTAADPIRIATANDLEVLGQSAPCFAGGYVFQQTADIDLSGGVWTPIADGSAFNGTYDGGGHRITGLRVIGGTGAIGLFANTNDATIRDLTLVAPDVSGASGAAASGALAGLSFFTDVSGVRVLGGRIAGFGETGGLIGGSCTSRVSGSSASITVTGTSRVGGLVGNVSTYCVVSLAGDVSVRTSAPSFDPGVYDSSASGAVTGTTRVGGLIGAVAGGSVARSSASGAVTADLYAGGLVGDLSIGYQPVSIPTSPDVVADVYATGAVTANRYAGGLIGTIDTSDAIERAYATGRVTAPADAGGLVGSPEITCVGAEVSVCSADVGVRAATGAFWDTTTTGQATSLTGFGVGRTTVQLQALSTYADAGWSIARGSGTAATWGICPTANGGYPFLTGQVGSATTACAGTPGKPVKVAVTSGDGEVTLSWQPPTGDGGSPVTGYTATATMQRQGGKAAKSCTVAATATRCTITGLVNGRAYRVRLTADNLEGSGTPATRTLTPRRAMAILATTRSGLAVVTRVRGREAGRLAQVGTARGAGAACRASRAVAKAGVVELTCTLGASARAALMEGDLRLRLVTRFTPTAGERRSATRTLVLARTAEATGVTG